MKALAIFPILIALAGCRTGSSMPLPAYKKTPAVNPAFYVVEFSPAASNVAAVPSSIVVAFNHADLDRSRLAVITHYNMSCAGVDYAAGSVDSATGYSSVTVSLQAINGLSSGTTCTFTVSSALKDAQGNSLGGNRSVSYRIE